MIQKSDSVQVCPDMFSPLRACDELFHSLFLFQKKLGYGNLEEKVTYSDVNVWCYVVFLVSQNVLMPKFCQLTTEVLVFCYGENQFFFFFKW